MAHGWSSEAGTEAMTWLGAHQPTGGAGPGAPMGGYSYHAPSSRPGLSKADGSLIEKVTARRYSAPGSARSGPEAGSSRAPSSLRAQSATLPANCGRTHRVP